MSAKRELFIWKKDDDKELLQEVIHEEPYQFPFGSPKRGGAIWTKIAENLAKHGLSKATQRSVRNRFNSLLEDYHTREREDKLASGIEVEYDEVYQALTEIDQRMSEWEEKSQEKEATERETAEDMRRKAVERLSSKKKRKKADEGAPGGDNSEERISPKKKSSHTNLVAMMEASVEMKRNEQEQQRQIRNRELDLRAAELQQQQQFQSMLLQQYQQQQQAMNMAMSNTVSEIFKSIKNP